MAVGAVDLPSGVEVQPGETVDVTIRFLDWDRLRDQLRPGRERRVQEGGVLVGIGTVPEVLS